jgi:hypothetical protein
MNNQEPIERLRLFVPCERQPEDVPVRNEWVDNPKDGSFAAAFGFGTVDKEGMQRIDRAAGALVLYCPFDLASGRDDALALIRKLPSALAVRVEQSKLGWEREPWLRLIGDSKPSSWHRAGVVMLTGKENVQSCGMHAFSLPDSRVETGGAAPAMQSLLTTLNTYQLAEDPVLLSGATFSPTADEPRRVLERWPDLGYPPSSPCHNPYGVWRLGTGGLGRPQPELTPVFVPTLVSILAAAAKKSGRPLSRAEVEALRDGSPCIAMKHRDAKNMEQARGYADLNPALAWEQWEAHRAARD